MFGKWIEWTGAKEEARECILMWEWQHVGVVKEKGADESPYWKRGSVSYVVVQGRYVERIGSETLFAQR